jgi:hypothetical protein
MKRLVIVELERRRPSAGLRESDCQSSDSHPSGDSTSDSGDHCGSANAE